jgi:N6-L-threonylcarbamoyladenine synthase
VLTRVRAMGALDDEARADLAASFQEAIVDVLVAKCLLAMEREGLASLVVAGGVGANASLREKLAQGAARRGAQVFFPPLHLCTDNGAMIAFAAALKFPEGRDGETSFPVYPRWDLAEAARATQSAPRR